MLTAEARQWIAQDAQVEMVVEVAGRIFAVCPIDDDRPATWASIELRVSEEAYYQQADSAVR